MNYADVIPYTVAHLGDLEALPDLSLSLSRRRHGSVGAALYHLSGTTGAMNVFPAHFHGLGSPRTHAFFVIGHHVMILPDALLFGLDGDSGARFLAPAVFLSVVANSWPLVTI